MKKNLSILASVFTIMLLGCTSEKNQYSSSDLNADFTVSENLDFKNFKNYDIPESGMCVFSDSVLWLFSDSRSEIGYCYDINSGEKLSTIAMLGKAGYEFTEYPAVKFVGDSIHFSQNWNTIKTFAINDIVENKPMNERAFSIITVPDSISTSGIVKLPNGSVVATIIPASYGDPTKSKHTINDNSIAIINSSEVNSYATIDFESYNIKDEFEKEKIDKIRLAYGQGQIATKGDDLAVFTVENQFILYIFDLNNKNVIKEKKYSRFQNIDNGTSVSKKNNNKKMSIYFLSSNDNYIFCHVKGYFNDVNKLEEAIFVFDWELNPIKRFNLPKEKSGYYMISANCNSVYFCKNTNEGMEVSKADLNLE